MRKWAKFAKINPAKINPAIIYTLLINTDKVASNSGSSTPVAAAQDSWNLSQNDASPISTTLSEDLDTSASRSVIGNDAQPGCSTSNVEQPSEVHSSLLSNPLVTSGIVPDHVLRNFIIPQSKRKEKSIRVRVTKSRVITSDEHQKAFQEKQEQLRLEEERKQARKIERERKKAGKDSGRGRGRGRGGRTNTPPINASTPVVNALVEEPSKEPARSSTRSVRRPLRYDVVESETDEEIIEESSSSISAEESDDDDEDWTCKKCLKDHGHASDFIGCDTCDRWFHKRCVNVVSEEVEFSCSFCC